VVEEVGNAGTAPCPDVDSLAADKPPRATNDPGTKGTRAVTSSATPAPRTLSAPGSALRRSRGSRDSGRGPLSSVRSLVGLAVRRGGRFLRGLEGVEGTSARQPHILARRRRSRAAGPLSHGDRQVTPVFGSSLVIPHLCHPATTGEEAALVRESPGADRPHTMRSRSERSTRRASPRSKPMPRQPVRVRVHRLEVHAAVVAPSPAGPRCTRGASGRASRAASARRRRRPPAGRHEGESDEEEGGSHRKRLRQDEPAAHVLLDLGLSQGRL
jgi:hypothetical protein